MDDTKHDAGALTAIRKNSILLLMAYDYLCEETFLIKIGKDIETHLQNLKEDISSLKKKFPGKFAIEVETGDILEKISVTAQALIKPGKDIKDRCKSGELGRGLESDVKSIADAVDQIKIQVHGKHSVYTRKDSVFNIFSGLRDIAHSLGSTLILAAKILICLIMIAIAAFLYLFFTMENEKAFLEEVAASREFISDSQKRLSQMELKKEEVSEEIKDLEKKDMIRGEKIAIMDLEMEIQKINQDRNIMEAEIIAHEKKITENLERIENVKKTSFIKRLLRQ
ncbi:hypothetical protein OAC89_02190 [Deltaproteobacteria bacterium]|nr:hypothetical protein [Deltaproteobacteria bacterium]